MAAKAETMTTGAVTGAYDRWAPIYDLVFGRVFEDGRARSIEAAERVGGRILEVGVGTGISLPLYKRTSRLTGIDLSPDMLQHARRRVREGDLRNVEALEVMDCEALAYDDASFDVVVAQYVVSAVPNPRRALDEFARVLRPGGEIVICTRDSASGGLRASVERALMPITSRLGFRTVFPFELYTDWAAANGTVRMVERTPLPPLGHFSMVRFAKL